MAEAGTAEQALAMLRTGDALPWPADEVDQLLVDSLAAVELLVELDERTDDELLAVLRGDGDALAPLADVLRHSRGDHEGTPR
jgi:hypothetical protein